MFGRKLGESLDIDLDFITKTWSDDVIFHPCISVKICPPSHLSHIKVDPWFMSATQTGSSGSLGRLVRHKAASLGLMLAGKELPVVNEPGSLAHLSLP